MVLFAQEQQEESAKGVHPYNIPADGEYAKVYSHWSLVPQIGFNIFDGDFNSEMKHAISYPNVGIAVEYSFTPAWNFGVDYMFSRYHVTGASDKAWNADVLLNGYMHELGAYLSMDLISLFFPRAKKKIIGIQPLVGVGYGWYRNTVMYDDDARGRTAYSEPTKMTKYSGAFFIRAGMNLEFNLNRTLALGVRAQYNYFVNDYIDGRGYRGARAVASKNNDGIFDITLNMRIKFEARPETHVRNITNEEVWTPIIPEPQCVHDTVIIIRDSIIVREKLVERREEVDNSQYYYVYFANNVSDLDEKGLVTIQQVADRLNEDEDLYAVVTGFCDNTGSSQLNYILGDKRAANVIEELRYEYGVPKDHLYAMGLGKVVGRGKQAAAYGPNRRAQIRLVDKETFERLKQNLDEKKEMRVIDTQTIPLSESARKAQINTYKSRKHEKVTVDKGTSLSKLAKQYYDNMYCWVYLYMANIDRIENPNALIEGSVLEIPELTKEELKITKEESLVLYGMSHQLK